MLPVVLSLLACGGAEEVPEVVAEVVQPVAPVERELAIPDKAPMSGEDIASGGIKEGAPNAPPDPNAELKAPPDEFNPVSVPLGRREGSVKWEGVKTKQAEQPNGELERSTMEPELRDLKRVDDN